MQFEVAYKRPVWEYTYITVDAVDEDEALELADLEVWEGEWQGPMFPDDDEIEVVYVRNLDETTLV